MTDKEAFHNTLYFVTYLVQICYVKDSLQAFSLSNNLLSNIIHVEILVVYRIKKTLTGQ